MQSSSHIITTNKPTSSFLQAGCPSCRPTNSVKALKGKYHILWTCLPQTHLGVFQLCLWPLIAPGYLGGGLPCLSSALWCQYPLVLTNWFTLLISYFGRWMTVQRRQLPVLSSMHFWPHERRKQAPQRQVVPTRLIVVVAHCRIPRRNRRYSRYEMCTAQARGYYFCMLTLCTAWCMCTCSVVDHQQVKPADPKPNFYSELQMACQIFVAAFWLSRKTMIANIFH